MAENGTGLNVSSERTSTIWAWVLSMLSSKNIYIQRIFESGCNRGKDVCFWKDGISDVDIMVIIIHLYEPRRTIFNMASGGWLFDLLLFVTASPTYRGSVNLQHLELGLVHQKKLAAIIAIMKWNQIILKYESRVKIRLRNRDIGLINDDDFTE